MSSFLPAKQNFTFIKGADFHYRFQWLNDNGIETTPQNVSGYEGRCALVSIPPGTIYMTLTTQNEGITFGGESGFIDLKIPALTTETVPWSVASYTLFVTNPETSETLALLSGRFIVQTSL